MPGDFFYGYFPSMSLMPSTHSGRYASPRAMGGRPHPGAVVVGMVFWWLSAVSPAGAQVPPDSSATGTNVVQPCPQGIISSIVVDSRPIFDPASTSIGALRWTYRTLNLLHINTREDFIRGELLFKEGDCFDQFLIDESYRLVDSHGFMYMEEMRVEDDGAGGHRVYVATRDEWSTKVDAYVTVDAGLNLERFQATEENLLGRGVFGEYTYYNRRETKTQSFGVFTPRFFGRSDASLAAGSTRAGHFFDQYWRYPIVGEAGHIGLRQGYRRATDYYAYSTDESDEPYSQILAPIRREQIELSGAYRFGPPAGSIIVGAGIQWDEVTLPRSPETITTDFDVRDSLTGPLPETLARQLRPSAATRVALHLGTRRFRYVDYTGIDDLRHTDRVGLGMIAGVTVGRSVGFLRQGGAPAEHDFYTREHLSFTVPIGISLLTGGGTLEARHADGSWRDILMDADLVLHGRVAALSSHTLFLRASTAGGWNTTIPFQLSLGGREGIRSLAEDRYPGGRLLRFILEDRVALPWPHDTADLGLTFFGDLGRVWAGDAPYGVDSPWQSAVGFGLRFGIPRTTRNIYRADIAFPVGNTTGSPIFRITLELNKLRSGFFTPDVERSRRFTVGPGSF
jgi:hypothetical protein